MLLKTIISPIKCSIAVTFSKHSDSITVAPSLRNDTNFSCFETSKIPWFHRNNFVQMYIAISINALVLAHILFVGDKVNTTLLTAKVGNSFYLCSLRTKMSWSDLLPSLSLKLLHTARF